MNEQVAPKKSHAAFGNKAPPTPYDFHPTPEVATRVLLDNVSFRGDIWEPASGSGAISKVLERAAYKVLSSDLQDNPSVYGRGGVDFLATRTAPALNLVTNPPYSILNEFMEHALRVVPRKVAFFVNSNGLFTLGRYKIYRENPPAQVILIPRPVPYQKQDGEWAMSGGMHHCWVIWDRSLVVNSTQLIWCSADRAITDHDRECSG